MKLLLNVIFFSAILTVPALSNAVQSDAIYVTDAATAARAREHCRKQFGREIDVVVGDADTKLYTPPKPIKQRQPEGSAPLRTKSEGDIWIDALVNFNGEIIAIALSHSDRPETEAAALAAMQTWTFEPARYKDTNVMSMISVPFNFDQLQNPETKAEKDDKGAGAPENEDRKDQRKPQPSRK